MINKNLYTALCACDPIGINIIKEHTNKNSFFNDYMYLNYDPDAWCFNYLTPNNFSAINITAQQNDNILTETDYYTHRRRTNIRVGSLARRLLGDVYTDQQYESFVIDLDREYKLLQMNFDSVEVLTGFDIRDAFHRNNSIQSGTLGKSCMRYARAQPYLRLYTNNPGIVKLITVKENGLIAARSLLWNDKYNDRIYYASNNARTILAAYAQSKKYFDAYENYATVQLSVQLDRWVFKYYPFVDTFKYVMPNGELLNFITDRKDTGEIRFLNQTNGGYYIRYICQKCGNLFGLMAYERDRNHTYCTSCRV